jgi:glutamate-1-semialdehyde 2,1-aminomutase
MLERVGYLACSQFETGFICASMDESLVDEVIAKIDEALEEIGRG